MALDIDGQGEADDRPISCTSMKNQSIELLMEKGGFMAAFTFNHIHLYSRDPMATAQYYHRMFDAKIIESVQTDGQRRIDIDINDLAIFILRVPAETDMPDSPVIPHLGLDHFGFLVSNLDKVAAELKRKGAEFAVEPYTIRPGVRIAYIQAPENVRVELVERS
jgi:catechol 2,3-dioxygenase-like lactoylglutathione lyase family enzyme